MKSKTMILMGVAIVCGLAASYMTRLVLADHAPKESEDEKVTVLVARQNLAMGQLVKDPEQLFAEKQFTRGEEPKKAIRSFEQLKDKRLNKPLSEEQFITPDDLSDKETMGIVGTMRNGMRAVGLKVNVEGVVGGFVLPLSHVDIVSVVRRNENDTVAKIILQDVLVLAVDTLSQRPEDKQAMVSNTVTVEVTPAQAETLSLASELGPLRLILRSFGDTAKVITTGMTPKNLARGSDGNGDELLAGKDGEGSRGGTHPLLSKVPEVPVTPAPVVVAKAIEPPPQPRTFVQTIYNGETRSQHVFDLDVLEGKSQIKKSNPEGEPAAQPGPESPPAGKPAKASPAKPALVPVAKKK